MKKLLLIITLITTGSYVSMAQLAVSDPFMTKLMAISNMYTSASATYSKLGAEMQQGTLSMVTKGADIATKNLDLLQKAVDVANIFMGSQVALDFFNSQRAILVKISQVSQDMYNIPGELLRPNVRAMITKNLDDGFVTATKSLQVAKNAFIQQQLNLTDRLSYIEEANRYLNDASRSIATAINIISNAKLVSNKLQSRAGTIKLLY